MKILNAAAITHSEVVAARCEIQPAQPKDIHYQSNANIAIESNENSIPGPPDQR